MIRQAISCDICGTEMLNANHWFVAYDRGAELRIGAWSGRNRVKASARHLCGHKCLHKLVDDFMARTISAPAQSDACDRSTGDSTRAQTGPYRMQALPTIASHSEEFDSSARLIKPAEVIPSRTSSGSHILRGEAWKRERQRQAEQSSVPRRSIA